MAAILSVVMAGHAFAEERIISVTGSGHVAAVPDMAALTLGVSHQAETAQDAMDMTSQAMAKVNERLSALGIEPRDIQTNNLSLHPVWNHVTDRETQQQRREVIGFSASNTVLVRVRDLDRLGEILGAAIGDGGNEMHGLSFSVSDPEPLLAEARAKAVKDAMEKAGQLAEAADVELGQVISITEHGGGGRPMAARADFAKEASVPIEAGEVSYGNSVSMVIAIAD